MMENSMWFFMRESYSQKSQRTKSSLEIEHKGKTEQKTIFLRFETG